MKLTFLGDRRVIVNMIEYLLYTLEEFGKKLTPVVTLERSNKIEVKTDPSKVSEEI